MICIKNNEKIKKIAKIISFVVLYSLFFFTVVGVVWTLINNFSISSMLYFILPLVQIFFTVRNANLRTDTFRSIFLDLIIPLVSAYFYVILALADIYHLKGIVQDLTIINIGTVLIWVGYVLSLFSIFYLGKYFTIFAEASGLVTTRAYKYIRNPIYTGYLISNIGALIKYFSLKAVIVSILYFLLIYIRAFEEEKLLEQKFGEEYIEYKRNTGRFLPKIKRIIRKK